MVGHLLLAAVAALFLPAAATAAEPLEVVLQGRTAGRDKPWQRPPVFSADGRLLLSPSNDGAILWDVATGRELRSFRGHKKLGSAVAFAPGDKTAVTAGDDGQLRFWDLRTGALLRAFAAGELAIRDIAYSPDGKLLAVAEAQKAVRLLDAETLAVKKQLLPSALAAIAFLAGGARVVSVQQYRVSISGGSDSFEQDAQGYGPAATGGEVLLTSSKTGVLVSDRDGKVLRTLGTGAPSVLAISRDGATAALLQHHTDSGETTSLALYDVASGALRKSLPLPIRYVGSAVFTPDARFLLCDDQLIDLRSGRAVQSFSGHARLQRFAAFSGDGRRLVTVSESWAGLPTRDYPNYLIRVWDLVTLRPTHSFHGAGLRTFETAPRLSPDGKRLWVPIHLEQQSQGSPVAELWDLDAGRILCQLPGEAAAFSSDGTRLVSSDGFGKELLIYDPATCAQRGKMKAFVNGNTLALSPGGNTALYLGPRRTVRLATQGAKSKETLATLPDTIDKLELAAWSPEGSVIALVPGFEASHGPRIWLYDARTKALLHTLELKDVPAYGTPIEALTFAPDGKRLFAGGSEGKVRAWDVATGKELPGLVGQLEEVTSVAASPDGKLLATAADQAVRLFRAGTGELLASLVVVDEADFAAISPGGYYAGSRGATRAIHFSRGYSIYPFESLDLLRNRPDLLAERVGVATKARVEALHKAWQKRLAILGFREEQLGSDAELPELQIVGSEPPLQSDQRELSFEIEAKDQRRALSRLLVSINEVAVHGLRGLPLEGPDAHKITRRVSVELSQGQNRIAVSALNDQGVESLRRTFMVSYGGPPRPRKLLVVAVGVSDYGSPEHDLRYAAKDAKDLSAALGAARRNLFAEVSTVQILDRAATREAILGARAALLKTQVDDQVVLFVAGHGIADEQRNYYFATSDIDFEHPAARGLPYEELERLLDGIPSRHKLLLMDTCFSGELDPTAPLAKVAVKVAEGTLTVRPGSRGISKVGFAIEDSFELMRELFADLRRGSGAVVISSAGGAESALESDEYKNGVFTFALLEGLRSGNADLDKDGVIRVGELRDYVTTKVQAMTQGQQRPTARRENLADDFPIY